MQVAHHCKPYTPVETGNYIETRLLMNRNEIHEKKLEKCKFLRGTGLIYLNEINAKKDHIELVFLSKVPDFIDPKSIYQPEKLQACLYFDLLYLQFTGEVSPSVEYTEFKFELPEFEEYADPTWSYPEKALTDMIHFLTHLSQSSLTEGFEEAFFIGPKYIRIENE